MNADGSVWVASRAPHSAPQARGVPPVVSRALRLIEAGVLDDSSVRELAGMSGIGERQLRRLFVRHLGLPPFRVAQARRLRNARRLIMHTRLPMAQIALESGFRSIRRFNAAFRDAHGYPPSELR